MAVVPMKRPVITEAERRGKLAADDAGEFVFNDVADYIGAMAAQVRSSDMKYSAVAKQSDVIKSPATVSKLAHGETRFPRFSTMFGVASALGLEVTFRRRQR